MDDQVPVSGPNTLIARAQAALQGRNRPAAQALVEQALVEQALAAPPTDAIALNALGSLLFELGDLARARALFESELAQNPHFGDALNNMGTVLAREGNLGPAQAFIERALEADRLNAAYLANLGGVLQARGRVEPALAAFEKALMADPGNADARWNRGIARLLSGDYAGGFADYEARWELPEFTARTFDMPAWRGEALDGHTLLVHSEQGFGDTIQMVRFARALAGKGMRVVLETHAPLVRVMSGVSGIAQVVMRGELLPYADAHVPIMSLPYRLGITRPEDVTCSPYVHAEGTAGRKIGLVWAGRPTHKNDANRSLALEACNPIAAVAKGRLVSLQVGPHAEDLKTVAWGREIEDLAPRLTDFAATAAAVAQLELVICVDTAVAHLAGAMGKECWLLLPFAPDWRWGLGRSDTPWYPSLKLFRQEKIGDWSGVVSRVAAALTTRPS